MGISSNREWYWGIDWDGECYVGELHTPLQWSPKRPKGFQWDGARAQYIALTAYGAFGDDFNWAREEADAWCEEAREYYRDVAEPEYHRYIARIREAE